MVVYSITNKVNSKQYVGQTTRDLNRRWFEHCLEGSTCVSLSRAIQKYGKENFEIKVLVRCNTIEEMNHREQYYIKLFNTLAPHGYNLTTGGDRAIMSEETRKKMSDSSKGKIAWNKGLTKEDSRVQSYVRSGESHHFFGKVGPRKGIKWDQEHIEAQRERMLGTKQSEESKNRKRIANMKPKPAGFSETMRVVQQKRAIKVLCLNNGIEYESISVAAKELDVNPGHIHRIIKGTLKQSKGYVFKDVSVRY